MRRFAALAVLFASPVAASAQLPGLSAAPTASPTNPFQVPGKVVGQYAVQPVGTQVGKVGQPAGKPVGAVPGGVAALPATSASIPGMNFDPKAVVGPLPASLAPPAEPSAWEKFVAKFGASIGLTTPQPKAPTWTPGISRRNRDRAEQRTQQWVRD